MVRPRLVNGLRTLSLSTLLACLSPAASAADAESFESPRTPKQCVTLFLSLDSILEARERGVPKNQIAEFAKTVDAKHAVPQEAIDAAFDEPRPRRQEVQFYCAFDGTQSPCLREAENAMLGRPADFTPRQPPPPPRAPARQQPAPN